jgi:NAD(P)-dependent dehydrogenase (short-subunit alcohol dehydrogenase family)
MGQRIAIILSERGAILALADQNAAGMTTTTEEIAKAKASSGAPGHTTTVLDVRDTAAVAAWIRGTVEKLGRLDGAVNFAGVVPESRGARIPIREGREDLWDLTVGVNAKGVWNCLRAELAVMQKGASIVNASSNLGLIGSPGLAAYAASKHAVVGMTRCAALEEGERGIRINCVCPGECTVPGGQILLLLFHNILPLPLSLGPFEFHRPQTVLNHKRNTQTCL